jgi:hypothetical protein
MMGIWRLLIDPRVHLEVRPNAHGAASRFVELFRATWAGVPADIQNALVAAWQRSGDDYPRFFLSEDLENHAPEVGTYGIYGAPGLFDFSATKITAMEDGLAEALIAHELAHCFLGHTGDYSAAHEEETDDLVESWGFPMGELRKAIMLPDTTSEPMPPS